jgi:hypothetical protein
VHVISPTTSASCATYSNTASLSASNNTTVTAMASLSVACPTKSLYTGTQAALLGNTVSLTAQVAGAAQCTNTGTVTFSLDRNPAPGQNPFPVAASVAGGVATGTTLSTIGWTAGVYTITASYAGPAYCKQSQDSATLTMGSAGISAGLAGLGRYTAPNTTTPYTLELTFVAGKGQVQMLNTASWQLKGTLTSLVKAPGNNGAATGVGTLSLGTLSVANVRFTVSFHANGAPYTFGVHISYLPTGSQPALPNALPLPLTSGAIRLT